MEGVFVDRLRGMQTRIAHVGCWRIRERGGGVRGSGDGDGSWSE